jgi:hypothetical protein
MNRAIKPKETTTLPIENTSRFTSLTKQTSVLAIMEISIAPAALAGFLLWMLGRPFRVGADLLPYVQDDFYYYLQVARNLAAGHGSTFNGLVTTNGYHPLWLLLLTAACFFVHSLKGAIAFVAVSSFIATLSTYFLSRRLLLDAGCGRLVSIALALFSAAYALHLFTCGMEVTLAIPFILGFALALQHSFDRFTFGRCFWLGLLASLTVLARLDSIILLGLIGIFIFAQPTLRRKVGPVQVAGLAAGLVPLGIYFAINRFVFSTWLPISGMAKQLKHGYLPTWPAWHSLFMKSAGQLLPVVLVALALLSLPFFYHRLSSIQRAVYPALLLFPFVYILLLSALSDWPLWDWYFYSFRPGLCVAFALFFGATRIRALRSWAFGVLFMLIAIVYIQRTSWDGTEYIITDSSRDVWNFSKTHPGIYAMGDAAGSVGYLLSDPVIQTEGLVMDRVFLKHIVQQEDLRDVLRDYHAQYYVTSTRKTYNGCYEAVEPFQAGPASPHMRSTFCEAPLARFQHGTKTTLIFGLEPSSHYSLAK